MITTTLDQDPKAPWRRVSQPHQCSVCYVKRETMGRRRAEEYAKVLRSPPQGTSPNSSTAPMCSRPAELPVAQNAVRTARLRRRVRCIKARVNPLLPAPAPAQTPLPPAFPLLGRKPTLGCFRTASWCSLRAGATFSTKSVGRPSRNPDAIKSVTLNTWNTDRAGTRGKARRQPLPPTSDVERTSRDAALQVAAQLLAGVEGHAGNSRFDGEKKA